MSKVIMSWSKCSVKIGKTGENDAMAASLKSVGTVKDKSTTLEPSEGEVLEAKATGGITVAKEQFEGGYTLTTRVIEPSDELFVELGLAKVDEEKGLMVSTHVVADDYSVEVSPKNVGAKGIRAPKTNVMFKPGYSEEEGQYVDITFSILKTYEDENDELGMWYTRFTKKAPVAPTPAE